MNTINSIIIRKMQADDIDAVLSIDQQKGGSRWTRQQFEQFIQNQTACYVLEKSQKTNRMLAGFMVFQITGDEAELLHLGVASNFQRQGYGKKLFQFLLSELKDKPVKQLFLEVRASNQAAIQLYESFGMQFLSRRKHYYGDEDAYVYRLFLT